MFLFLGFFRLVSHDENTKDDCVFFLPYPSEKRKEKSEQVTVDYAERFEEKLLFTLSFEKERHFNMFPTSLSLSFLKYVLRVSM